MTEENYENAEFPDEMVGQIFGVYKIVEEIGRGGMGVVYLAERIDGFYRQDVAIKFIKRGMDTDTILKRFRNERQILASLNHPNIALLYDGGTTSDGLPYFIMENVKGEPLFEFCDNRKLNLKERLKIFVQVCEAVHAAHHIKVVHRDLKPSNILVKADGTPKLLDFGIAKLLDPDLADTFIEPTATQMRMMTPEYASPEQVCGGKITIASDIYSLGVLLYKLLSGHRPYRLKNRSPYEIARVICEESPESLSESLTMKNLSGEEDKDFSLEEILKNRSATIEELSREFSGELEQIVINALQKDPADRYRTALEFADDIRRYLQGKPIRKHSPKPFQTPSAGKTRDKISVAVLPLKTIAANMNEDSGDAFLSFGLADALVSRLSAVNRLIVRPTSSILRYSHMDTDVFTAGAELNVEYLVHGTIRRFNERIRVSVQLLHIAEQATHWAQSFDEKFTDVLEIEDLISERIVKTIIPQLTGEEKDQLARRGTNSVEAYEAHLRGRYYWNLFTGDALVKALESFNQAIALDPNYALPHVGLADYYAWLSIFGLMPSNEGFSKSKEAARRALEIDGKSGEAYAVLGFVTLCYDWNWTEAERYLIRALELAPNYSLAHEFYSNVLVSSGRFDKGVREINKAEELAPLSPRGLLLSAWTYYQARDFAEAVKRARTGNDMQKDFPQGLLHLGNVLTQVGQTAEAIEKLRQSSDLWKESGMPQYMLCFALAADGNLDEARRVAEALKESAEKGYVKPYFVAMAHVAIGEKDAAFDWFEKAFKERNEWFIWFGTDPKLDAVRSDPRYLDLLRRTTNPIRQKQSPTTSAESGKSIAVLPFKTISMPKTGDTEEEYLSIGLADALITRLSNVRRLTVRPTTSVMQFHNRVIGPVSAGQSLNVEYIVDGTIRRSGGRVRVSVQLLKVSVETTLWAESFDEKFTDVLELEDSISEQVTKALIPQLTTTEQRKLSRRETNNPQAYEAHLRGRYHWNQFTPESLPKAREAFQTAVALDPNYALAYVGLADFYIWGTIYGLIPSKPALAEAESFARRAIEIDDTLGEAYASLGLVLQNRKQWDEARRLKMKALKLNPNYVHAHEWFAAQLTGLGKTDEGVREILIAERLDPLSLRTKTLVAWNFYQSYMFDEAFKRGQQIIDLDKYYPQGYLQTGLGLWGMERFEEALLYFEKGDELMPNSALAKYQLCFALVSAGRREKAQKVLEDIKTMAAETYVKPYFLAMAHTALGNFDEAFALFEQSAAEDDPWMVWLNTEPMLTRLRKDARFRELLLQMKHPA